MVEIDRNEKIKIKLHGWQYFISYLFGQNAFCVKLTLLLSRASEKTLSVKYVREKRSSSLWLLFLFPVIFFILFILLLLYGWCWQEAIQYFDNNDYIHVLNTLYCCYSWRCPISTNKLVSAPHSRHKAKDGGMDHYSSRESNFAKLSQQKLALNTAFEGNVQRWLSFLQATIIDKNIYK